MQGNNVTAEDRKKVGRIVLAGNPNVGKSVIFGILTGKYATVSNYPGTTVEVSSGNIEQSGKKFLLIDSPGVNSFIPMSEDEQVTRDILLEEKHENVILVADSKNLKRSMMLLIQLAEMDLPCILVLNMEDEARARGIETDYRKLETILGVRVIGTVAPQRKGLAKLKESLLLGKKPQVSVNYGQHIEQGIEKISSLLPRTNISRRSIALMLLSGDTSLKGWCVAHLDAQTLEKIEDIIDEVLASLKVPVSNVLSQIRIDFAEDIVRSVVEKSGLQTGDLLRRIGTWTMHPFWGIFSLLFVLFCFYKLVGEFGAGTLVDFFEEVIFGRYLIPGIEKGVKLLIPFAFLQDFLVGQYGLITMALTYAVAIVLPITATFFIAFGLLEDSGYLPRIAVLTNNLFSKIGLNGKAVLPMVLGLGCGTMATMTTRILETKRERIIATFLIALAIPCSAQLGVIMGMLGTYSARVFIWWLGTVLFVLLLAGSIAARVLPGEKADFFLELPPIRVPRIGNILMKTLNRIEWYLKEAVPLFLLGTSILFVLDRTQMLRWIEIAASPVIVALLGLPEKATGIFIMGFLRRDYGAAGVFDLARQGLLDENQIIVSIITLTLFIPCLASFFMIIKERGLRTSLWMFSLITLFALMVGGAANFILRLLS